jgi:outer membrane protein insertion porin family
MRIIGLKSGLLRTTSVCVSVALTLSSAGAQPVVPAVPVVAPSSGTAAPTPAPVAPVPTSAPAAEASAPTASAPVSAPAAHIIQHIVVNGVQRVEPSTVLTYLGLREGDVYDRTATNDALKAVQASGLFAPTTTTDFNEATGTLTITVTENPIVNQVVFEGNSKVSEKDLTKEIQIKPRGVFTRAKVQADVARIQELYRRNGKFAARIQPEIIARPQNRVDLIFSISEGPTTGVSRINFVGNKVFTSDVLRSQILTEESAWYKFLSSSDNYDADRLTYDKEMLRRYYVSRGYADFKVLSAVAQLTPGGGSFFITFTVDEGQRYKFGPVSIDSKIPELSQAQLLPLLKFRTGDIYNQDLLQKAIDSLTNAAGGKGYAFADVQPVINPNRDKRTIDVSFKITQGQRVYIERIDITGNTRTADKVIRREFRLVEGDAFNQVLVDRSRTRIRALGFFSEVTVNKVPGSQPDRTDVTVAVTEQSTGSISVGVGYSTQSSILGDISYTDTNWFGLGQQVASVARVSQIQKQFQLSFTEPWFLDRPLAAGIDLQKVLTDYQQATFEGDTTVGSLRLGFPVSDVSTVSLSYSYEIQQVHPFSSAPLEILLAAGKQEGSIIGYQFTLDETDDPRKPTSGYSFNLAQNFAGFGGSLRYIQNQAGFVTLTPMFGGDMIGSFALRGGYVTGYDGTAVPINTRFFKGGDDFRGFSYAGVGPRDVAQANNLGAVGGNLFVIGTLTARLPALFPESYGISMSLFTDFGTIGHVDDITSRTCTLSSCIRDNLALRVTTGISFGWKSPFGPLNVDLGVPIVKAPYDRAQIIHISTATGL